MNITELESGFRVMVSEDGEKEIAVVRGFTPEGKVRIRPTFGEDREVDPECVIKIIGG